MDKLHILVVDDNHINRLFFQSSLKKLNCAVTTAINGIEAITKCKTNSYDLILMDIRMDGMNGIESAAQIKQLKPYLTTPIIAISAETFNTDMHKDFCDSLLKPVKQEVLAQTIELYTTKPDLFNHKQALKISHHDERIVLHLRKLFIEQLDQVRNELLAQYSSCDFVTLNESLHQLLGSAKICAADQMVKEILAFKNDRTAVRFNRLLNTIEAIQNQST